MYYDGNLTLTNDNIADYREFASVGGDLIIDAANAALQSLKSVGGGLWINGTNTDLPNLTTVRRSLSIHGNNAGLTSLTRVGIDLWIYADNADLPNVSSVGGNLYIDAPNAGLTALTSLGGLPFSEPSANIIRQRMERIATAALASGDALNMSEWHTCATTHCIAGWAVHLEGESGYALETKVGSTANAGIHLLGTEISSHFQDTTEKAREWLKTWLPLSAV